MRGTTSTIGECSCSRTPSSSRKPRNQRNILRYQDLKYLSSGVPIRYRDRPVLFVLLVLLLRCWLFSLLMTASSLSICPTDKWLHLVWECVWFSHSVWATEEEGVSSLPGRQWGGEALLDTGHLGPLLQPHAPSQRYAIYLLVEPGMYAFTYVCNCVCTYVCTSTTVLVLILLFSLHLSLLQTNTSRPMAPELSPP